MPVLLVLDPHRQIDGCEIGGIGCAAGCLDDVLEPVSLERIIDAWIRDGACNVDLQLRPGLGGWSGQDDLEAAAGRASEQQENAA